ncbi:hypothetical protein [Stieleria varia]|uniref:Uncharacterized protein n=1 Tax=Stieleria varia TaxID=2528005 RepID=A0A5C5ZQH2_9BACT|nr:hypothetical protein [Stieleria varia]TWT89456.1 hypothetical protein Pla52n_67950 [Stieleria varia]
MQAVTKQPFLFGLVISSCITVMALRGTNSKADETSPGLIHSPTHADPIRQRLYVITGDAGTAALLLENIDERANATGNGIVWVPFQWRYLERGAKSETTGNGKLFAKLKDGKVEASGSEISIGPYQLHWHYLQDGKGELVFDAHELSLHPVVAHRFLDEENQKAVDLASFLTPDAEIQKQYREAEKRFKGPDSDPISFDGNVAASVPYEGSVLLVEHESGLATFHFREVFERQDEPNVTDYGVKYDFQIFPTEGASAIGKDEVYEHYVNKVYNNGRLNLQADLIFLQWSRGGSKSGWVYYNPHWMRVWVVAEGDVTTLIDILQSRK